MTKQRQISPLFTSRLLSYQAKPTRVASRIKRQLRQSRLTHLLFLVLLVAGPSLVVWNPQAVYAQATPQAAQTDNMGRVAVIGVDAAPLYAAPGGATLKTLTPGTPVTVVGRSQDGQWVQVADSTAGQGWMAVSQVIIFGIDQLPVVGVTPAATQATAQTPTLSASVQETTPATATVTAPPAANATPAPTTVPEVNNNAPVVVEQSSVTPTATINTSALNVRAGPGTNYPVLIKATTGQVYPAEGRNAASNWVQIALSAEQSGWVSASYVKLNRAVSALPLSNQVSAVPVSQATPTAVAAPANTVSVQTASTAANPPAQTKTGNVSASAATGLQGTLVFEASNGGAIYVYQFATGALRQLTSGFDPAVSPDGSKVAFTRDGGDNGLYVINIDGSNEHKIYSGNESLRSPKWSPDGNWIVFGHVSATYLCYQMGPSCLTRTDLKKRLPASIANDPDALEKFLKNSDAVETKNALLGISRVDTNGQQYRDIPALNSASSPDWSNSGIVYQSADGLQKTADKPDAQNQLVLEEHYVQDPDWQPNGGRIVYQSRQGPHWEIFTVNDDGSGEVALTRPETTLVDQLPSNVAPAWSPDGQHIVFLSNRQDNHEAGDWRIWVMNADGSNQHPLPINVPLDYGYTDEQMVSWGK